MASGVPGTVGALLVLGAIAAGPEDWAALHSGRLMHALDRDAPAAISVYEAVVEHLDDDDPIRADYLYWLGRAWFDRQRLDSAQAALQRVDGRAPVSAAAQAFHGRIALESGRLSQIPVEVDPVATPRPIVPGWGSKGTFYTITPSSPDSPATISWPIATDDVRAGFIAMGLAPGAGALGRIRFEAQSSEVVLAARVVVESSNGQTYSGMPSVLRPGSWTPVEAPVSQLRPQNPSDPPLDPTRVNMIAIEVAPLDPGAVSSSARVLLRTINLDGPS